MTKLAYFGYEPGITDGNDKSSTGNAHWLRRLFSELEKNKIEVINGSIGEKSDREEMFEEAAFDGDVFLFSWRWPMDESKYPQRMKAYRRQAAMLEFAHRCQIPCIIHDSDMMQPDILNELSELNPDAILTAPTLFPPKRYQQLLFPRPYEDVPYVPLKNRYYEIAYIGNNYMRYEQMKRVYNSYHGKYQIDVWGNWKEKVSPSLLEEDFPDVTFEDKINQSDIQDLLSHAVLTHQFAKPIYCETGFLTPRLHEATSAGCAVIFPDEFKLPEKYEGIFKGLDVDQLFESELYHEAVVESQREVAKELDGTQEFLNLIKSL